MELFHQYIWQITSRWANLNEKPFSDYNQRNFSRGAFKNWDQRHHSSSKLVQKIKCFKIQQQLFRASEKVRRQGQMQILPSRNAG